MESLTFPGVFRQECAESATMAVLEDEFSGSDRPRKENSVCEFSCVQTLVADKAAGGPPVPKEGSKMLGKRLNGNDVRLEFIQKHGFAYLHVRQLEKVSQNVGCAPGFRCMSLDLEETHRLFCPARPVSLSKVQDKRIWNGTQWPISQLCCR